jgi:predicted PurR-regulated permease PerM
VNLFHRLHIPQALGAVVVIVCFILALWIVFSNLLQPAREWVEKTPENLRRAETKIQHLIRPVTRAAERVQNIARETTEHAPEPRVPKVEVQKSPVDASFLNLASSFFMTSVETIVLVYFFLAMGEKLTSSFVNALSAARNKQKAVEITHELQKNISAFLFTISCINVGFGVLVGLGAMLVGMPNALLWGAMAAVLNFIPYFGPLTGVVVLAIAGFVTFDTIGHALLPPAIYLALHTVESNFFTPLLLGRRLTMNPVMIFISLMFWTWLWGIPGALLSVPLLAMIKIICDHFKSLRPISEFIAGEEKRKRLRFG